MSRTTGSSKTLGGINKDTTIVKNYLTITLFLIGQMLVCQNDIPDFEFGHELSDEFYYEFIDENVSFIDLTRDKYFQKRKEHKIKRITVKHLGLSLDSLYLHDTTFFYYMIRTGAFDHGYSYEETSNYDDNGFTISKTTFPLTSYLNKKDSIQLNLRRTSSTKLFDSLTVANYFKDTIWEKKVYLKNIIYRTYKEAIITTLYDTATNMHTGKLTGYNVIPTRYFYNEDGNISRIKCDAIQNNYYNMTFNLSDDKNIIIKCSFRRSPYDSINKLENKISKNKLGQILTSTFYHDGKSNDFSSYSFFYDKHNNLIKVNRRRKAERWFDYTEKLYKFDHIYKNGKLNKTKVHYNFNMVNNDIIYSYNDIGLISELVVGVYKIHYEYKQN